MFNAFEVDSSAGCQIHTCTYVYDLCLQKQAISHIVYTLVKLYLTYGKGFIEK